MSYWDAEGNLDISGKRDAKATGMEVGGRDKDKRRRSSLSSKRRSIIHSATPSKSDPNSKSPSQTSAAVIANVKETAQLDHNEHKNNMIQNMHSKLAKIKLFDNEYAKWKSALKELEAKEENTNILALNLNPITFSDIPKDIKQMAQDQYLTSEMVDLAATKETVGNNLLKMHLSIESCLQDLKLFKSYETAVRWSNTLASRQLAEALENIMEDSDDEENDSRFRTDDSSELTKLNDRNGPSPDLNLAHLLECSPSDE